MSRTPHNARSVLPLGLILLSLLLLLLTPQMVRRERRTAEEARLRIVEPATRRVEALETILLLESAAAREAIVTGDSSAMERLRVVQTRRSETLEALTSLALVLSGETARELAGLRADIARTDTVSELVFKEASGEPSERMELLRESEARAQARVAHVRTLLGRLEATQDREMRAWERMGDILAVLLVALGIGAALVVFRVHRRMSMMATRADRARREKSALLESTGEGVFGTDLEGRCTFINRSAAEMLGYEPGDLIGERIHELVHGRHAGGTRHPAEASPIMRTLQTGGSVRIDDEVFWTRDGRPFPVEYGVFPLMEGGQRRGVVVNFLDITARKESESQRNILLEREREARTKAERAEQQSRLLADVSETLAQSLDFDTTLRNFSRLLVPAFADSCVIHLLDETGQLQRVEHTHANPVNQQLVQERVMLDPPRIETLIDPVRDALLLGRTSRLSDSAIEGVRNLPEKLENHDNPSVSPERSFIATPLRIHSRIVGAISYSSSRPGQFDTPEAKQLVEELALRAALAVENAQHYRTTQQALHAREEVLRIVSHDLRSPLSVVQMGTQALLRHRSTLAEDRLVRRQLEVMNASAHRMGRLIQDLLDLAQIDRGHLSIIAEPTEIRQLVAEVLDTIAAEAHEKGISVESCLPQQLPAAHIDRARIQQVFTNLLSNAIESTSHGGKITVSAALDGSDQVRFAVADTGCGIEPEHLPLLFDRYWQAHRRRSSLGLGLAITKGIIDGHAGKIWAESREGEGSTFFFTLPICKTTQIPSAANASDEKTAYPMKRASGTGYVRMV